ncbi:MAG: hypothetical protein R2873_10605 [Caldilineaceae bacterium]
MCRLIFSMSRRWGIGLPIDGGAGFLMWTCRWCRCPICPITQLGDTPGHRHLARSGTGPSLMLCGHTDTSDWQGRPFREDEWTHRSLCRRYRGWLSLRIGRDRRQRWRRSILMAAGMVVCAKPSVPLKGDLIVACVVAETGRCGRAQHLIQSGLRPDYCIVTEAGDLDVGVISVGYVQGKVKVIGEFKHRVPYINPIEKICR